MASPETPCSSDRITRMPHVALLPSSGMGHLIPFCRLAVALSGLSCDVSVVSVLPTVSSAESRHLAALFASFPRIRRLDFELPPFDASAFPNADPFLLRFEALRRSAHTVLSLLAGASPPFSALIVDVPLASSFVPVMAELCIPQYILFISSAMMLSFCAYFPTYVDTKATAGLSDVDIPSLRRVAKPSMPQALHNPHHLFTTQFVENGRVLPRTAGILINTFECFEPEALAALRHGGFMPGFPPVFPVGPLAPAMFLSHQQESSALPWLDEQPARSVVYVCFGNRTAISKEQMKQLALGLDTCGCRFLWVVKSTVVDNEDETELKDLLGDEYLERVEGRGLVIKGWVMQEEVLKHQAVGLFLSHSGWNSVTEAAMHGMPVLAWPRGGDQRVNAEALERSGLGVWMEGWSWEGEEGVVSGEEIGKKVREVMGDEVVKAAAARVGEEAAKAVAAGGSSYQALVEFIGNLKG